MICLTSEAAALDGGTPQEYCLAYYDEADDEWRCEDPQLLSGGPAQSVSGDTKVLCGYTSHFTLFGVMRKDSPNDGGALDAPNRIESDGDDDGLPGWALALIIAAGVLCLICLIVLCVCLVLRRRNSDNGTTEMSSRSRNNVEMQSYQRNNNAGAAVALSLIHI